jgi:hypothetical protein
MSKFGIFCAMLGVARRPVLTDVRHRVSGSFAIKKEDVCAIIRNFSPRGGT